MWAFRTREKRSEQKMKGGRELVKKEGVTIQIIDTIATQMGGNLQG